MPLAPGTQIGSYDITAQLGAGGMGEVYRARDTRLNRDVAIKVLPQLFASDPERLARFEREAQTLASLNHPNIAHIHGIVEPSGAVPAALVMECVEGEDLAERLARGPLPMDEALAIARQIAEGLGAAHDRGIVHRDLKPANVKVSPDGVVKILDFGLAKAAEKHAMTMDSSAEIANSPTFTATSTQVGIILGTAAYMSPEQARGKRVDHRADIWAFACVLYEMLTGAKPFQSGDDSVAGVLAKILERDPDFGLLPRNTPASIRRLLRRSFEKNPSRRLASAHDATLEIDDARSGAEGVASVDARPERRTSLPWLIVAGLSVALALAAVALWRSARSVPASVMRYDIQLPPNVSVSLSQWPPVAISHDGSLVAFVGESEGGTQLFLRRRDEATVQPVSGTNGASSPAFSPDGRWLTFAAGRDLKKMMIGSGPTTVASLETSRGATWLDDGSIVYSPDAAAGLLRLPAAGGPPQNLTTLDSAKGERSHRWPVALPGGKVVLFIVGVNGSPDDYNNSDVDAVIVATGERRHLLTGASYVQFVPGFLIFMRNGAIHAVPFDPDTLAVTGTPRPVVDGVGGDVTTGSAAFACAADGTLVYAAGAAGGNGNLRRLVWADRTGRAELLNLPPAPYNDERVSPDGSRVAVVVGATGSGDVWIHDTTRGSFTRLTFDRNAGTPVWSHDGRSVYYVAIDPATGRTTFYRKPVDGSRDRAQVGVANGRSFLLSVNETGDRLMIVKTTNTQTRVADIVTLAVPGGQESPVVATGADEFSGSTSPDGRWLAYQSNESGRYEIYVRDLREGGGRWQVSTAGGEEPRWSADGRELFFRSDTRFMHAAVASQDSFRAETPLKLFDGIFNVRSDTGVSFDVDPKTGRFLMTRPADPAAPPSVTALDVVLNWFADLRRAK
ncbi:MAG TPA: protein kinase [Vicinamibacterales bacterium]|jgi:serine/threonine protein kinase/Tol biopolymer transport system component|nr:protein kinase [Vicinamibacterales bacterium]